MSLLLLSAISASFLLPSCADSLCNMLVCIAVESSKFEHDYISNILPQPLLHMAGFDLNLRLFGSWRAADPNVGQQGAPQVAHRVGRLGYSIIFLDFSRNLGCLPNLFGCPPCSSRNLFKIHLSGPSPRILMQKASHNPNLDSTLEWQDRKLEREVRNGSAYTKGNGLDCNWSAGLGLQSNNGLWCWDWPLCRDLLQLSRGGQNGGVSMWTEQSGEAFRRNDIIICTK